MTINELGKKIKTLKGYPLRTDIAVTVINSEDSVSDNPINDTTIVFELYDMNYQINLTLHDDGTWDYETIGEKK